MNLTITANNTDELITKVLELAKRLEMTLPLQVTVQAVTESVVEAPVKEKKKAAKKADVVTETVTATVTTPSTRTDYSHEDVIKAAQDLMAVKGVEAPRTLLAKYADAHGEPCPRLSAIQEKDRGAFIADCKEAM